MSDAFACMDVAMSSFHTQAPINLVCVRCVLATRAIRHGYSCPCKKIRVHDLDGSLTAAKVCGGYYMH